jgi:hypothetical protein
MDSVILFLILSAGNGWHEIKEIGPYDSMEHCIQVGRNYQAQYPEQIKGYICREVDGVTAEHHTR